MKKRRIVLASVLKPADEVRMAGKLAMTLFNTGRWDITVMGYPPASPTTLPFPMIVSRPFRRISLDRLREPWRQLQHWLRLQPDVLIISSQEQLAAAAVLRRLRHTRIVYDVQENYAANIRFAGPYPLTVRRVLARLVALWESFFAAAVDHFLLAEAVYADELHFFQHRYTILENKYQGSEIHRQPDPACRQLVFTGTLAESTGVFRAIALADQLHAVDPAFRLHLCGFAPHDNTRARIREAIDGKPYITLTGGDQPVSHAVIQNAIQQAHAGLICYPELPHTAGRVPTKLFEYLAARLPVITESRWPWVKTYAAYRPFILTSFEEPQAAEVLQTLQRGDFYPNPVPGVLWNEMAPLLVQAIDSLPEHRKTSK